MYIGYCVVRYYPDEHTPAGLWEQRPWQQILIHDQLGKFSLQHRFRMEERFNQVYQNDHVKGSYLFTWRFRYKLSIKYPIWKSRKDEKSLQVLLSDELFTSFGKNVVLSYFNQNRMFLGLVLSLRNNWNASLGYTEIVRSTSDAGLYVKVHAPTITINHKLDFRKNK